MRAHPHHLYVCKQYPYLCVCVCMCLYVGGNISVVCGALRWQLTLGACTLTHAPTCTLLLSCIHTHTHMHTRIHASTQVLQQYVMVMNEHADALVAKLDRAAAAAAAAAQTDKRKGTVDVFEFITLAALGTRPPAPLCLCMGTP
jgi:hypothetical protein